MTIEMWQIVLQAVIAVGLIGYGVWLRFVIKQQLQSKDGVIEALKATITTHEAHITALKNDTAPAITKAYGEMRQFANHQTELAIQLSGQYQALSTRLKVKEVVETAHRTLSETNGLLLAQQILHENLGKRIFVKGRATPPEISADSMIFIIDGYMKSFKLLNQEVKNRQATTQDVIDQLGPSSSSPPLLER